MNSLDERKDVLRSFGQYCGAVGDKEVAVSEAPEDGDARQACIGCRLKVNVRISDINRFGCRDTELRQRRLNHVGSRFARDARLFADGNVNHPVEEGACQFRHTCLQFVTHDRHSIALRIEGCEQRSNALIELGVVLTVDDIMRTEGIEALLEHSRLSPFRNSPLDKFPHTVPHETSHFFNTPLGKAATPQRMIHTYKKVVERIGQSSVEVEYDCLVFHFLIFRVQRYNKNKKFERKTSNKINRHNLTFCSQNDESAYTVIFTSKKLRPSFRASRV